ncbi:MAG: tungsten formylmethanofuran dehydrogenase [Chitinophagales bacterium]|nr:tungsten formylmethanofuran dehydrogenase [Chitinophagales bacterium]MCB9018896.1 tungsten formylmethanofuran dehydrogenase [Chitinophagales bacterium]MCB9022574.1 tungsten formylmethanofuran dehydrogenase [Chitinophagales bacterium]HAE36031.1 tungsten formylmethanofuran dehydrogenase [Bacteroidota bacterium]
MQAYRKMYTSMVMSQVFDENRQICIYVHANSRGHEAIQLAAGMQLKSSDWASLYYRDDSILMGMGWEPYEIMLQQMAKRDDPFSGGRNYYCHPSWRGKGKPQMIHQSSATGMQAIPSTGIAQGIQYMTEQGLLETAADNPIVLCSIGDGAMTEGEVSEALQFAVLKELPVIYLVQDNDWGISVAGHEARVMNAYEYAAGFPGLQRMQVDGSLFLDSWQTMEQAISYVRQHRKPVLVHAKVPLLGHHTSGVKKEMYRSTEDLAAHALRDPLPKLRSLLIDMGVQTSELEAIESHLDTSVRNDFERVVASPDPDPETVADHEFAPALMTEETGTREPEGAPVVIMVDAALHAMKEILAAHPEALFYGQDVGRRLGGVFREAATLADTYGDHRVFNTAIQEAYIVGSTAGMSAVGARPIVEIQFADYIWTGVNQLVSEISKSCYLTNGKWPVSAVIRIPIGAYGSGGPYHSGSIESSITAIKGIKVVYPSNAADMKGLLKGAYYDPNPVIMFEHKGLYWSKVPGTQAAKTPDPADDYIIPLGKARIFQHADAGATDNGESMVVVTYGMGVHWAVNASRNFPGQVEILDLRTLYPYDWESVKQSVMRHGKCFVLTEEPLINSFAQALAGRIGSECFTHLDAPVQTLGSLDLPAVPLNSGLEKAMLPNTDKVSAVMADLLSW